MNNLKGDPGSNDSSREDLISGEHLEPVRAPASTLDLLDPWEEREEEIAEKLEHYVGYLLRQNRRFNLTGDRTAALQWAAHIEDALQAARCIEQHRAGARIEGQRVVDVGSGGGVPGLIWALLWPGCRVTLVEATGKKARFLESAAGLLGLANVEVQAERAEDLARRGGFRQAFDIATARALAPLPVLAEWTLPFLRIGGFLYAIKGPEVKDEIDAARGAMTKLGAAPEPELFTYARADGRSCHVLVYAKQSATPDGFPRRGGAARRRPL